MACEQKNSAAREHAGKSDGGGAEETIEAAEENSGTAQDNAIDIAQKFDYNKGGNRFKKDDTICLPAFGKRRR